MMWHSRRGNATRKLPDPALVSEISFQPVFFSPEFFESMKASAWNRRVEAASTRPAQAMFSEDADEKEKSLFASRKAFGLH
jgi:hypothetical protein